MRIGLAGSGTGVLACSTCRLPSGCMLLPSSSPGKRGDRQRTEGEKRHSTGLDRVVAAPLKLIFSRAFVLVLMRLYLSTTCVFVLLQQGLLHSPA